MGNVMTPALERNFALFLAPSRAVCGLLLTLLSLAVIGGCMAEACDPSTDQASCDGDVAHTCSGYSEINGSSHWQDETCSKDEVCVVTRLDSGSSMARCQAR
jgi:hypothetical protein